VRLRWNIKRFQHQLGKVGDFLKSPIFATDAGRWFIKAELEKNEKDVYLSAYLYYDDVDTLEEIKADYIISILKSDGTKGSSAKTVTTIEKGCRGWASIVVAISDLLSGGYLSGDDNGLIIEVELKAFYPPF